MGNTGPMEQCAFRVVWDKENDNLFWLETKEWKGTGLAELEFPSRQVLVSIHVGPFQGHWSAVEALQKRTGHTP